MTKTKSKSGRKKKKAAAAAAEATAAAAITAEWLGGKGTQADEEKSVSSRRSSRLKPKKAAREEKEKASPPHVLTYGPTLPSVQESDRGSDDDEEDTDAGLGGGYGSESSESEESSSEEEDEEEAAKKPSVVKKNKKTAKKPPGAANKSQPSTVTDGITNVLEAQNTPERTRGLIELTASHSTTDFFNLLMTTDKLVALGMMLTGSPYLVVAHSSGMYRDFDNPNSVENGAYTFVGAGHTTALQLTRGWLNTKSAKQGPIDDAPIKTQMAADPTQLWGGYDNLDADKKEVKDAPSMLLLFPEFAKFLHQAKRTPLEALVWMDDFVQEKKLNESVVDVHYNYLKLVACAKKPTGNESIMALQAKPLILPSKEFVEWMGKRLEGTGVMGQDAAVVTPTKSPQATPSNSTNHQQSQNADDIKHLTAVVKVMAEGMGTMVTQSAKGSKSKPTKLSSRNTWRLVGLCNVTSPAHIPPVWIEMLKSDTLKDCVAIFKNAKKRENDLINAGMQQPTYFESQFKKVLDMNLVPEENYSEHTRHDVALGFADSLPRTDQEVRRLRSHDDTMNSTPEQTL